jgi:outer membrane receptor protein involved in Fe transport
MLLVASALLGWAGNAAADGAPDLEAALEQPVVSAASKTAEAASTAPATATIITAEDLRRYGVHSLDEAINFLSMGMITQNPLHSVDVGARGVLLTADYGNHVLLLVDGHVMNEQWGGTAYFERGAAVPFELIDHIEVILGPGSVLYGSNAMLGVINIVTKRAKDYEGVHLIGEAEVHSLRGGAGAGSTFKLFGEPGEVTFQAEYYTQRGPTFAFGPQLGGAWGGEADDSYWTQIPAGYLRVVLGDFEASFRAATYKRGTPYVNSFNQFSGDFDDPDGYELDRWLSADLKHRAHIGQVMTLTSRVYADTYDYQQYLTSTNPDECLPGQDQGCRTGLIGVSRWIGAELQTNFDWFGSGMLTTMIGVDGKLRRVGSRQDAVDLVTGENPGSFGSYEQDERAVAVYGQQTFNPVPWLGLNGGLRYDLDERFGSSLSPRAAVSVSPWQGGTLKAIYSQAFRAPSSYESFYVDPDYQVASDELRPETVRSVEASVEHRFGSHRIMAGVFRSWWYDMVFLGSLSPAELQTAISAGELVPGSTEGVVFRNAAQIDNWGFNAGAEGSLASRRLHYGINVTGAQSRRDVAGDDLTAQELPVAPQFFGNARLAYQLPGNLPTLGLVVRWTGKRPADRAFDGAFTPRPYAPPQIELKGTVSGDVTFVKGLSYRVTGGYAFAAEAPYVAGPVQAATPEQPAAELAPVEQFKASVGLQYDFDL